MYVSVANVAFNISLYFLFMGNYESTEDVGWMAVDEIRNELYHPLLHNTDEDWTVETGLTTEDSKCAYINFNFSAILRYPIEQADDAVTEHLVQSLYNLTDPKQYIVGQNSSLERLGKNHNCSRCSLDNSSTLCNFLPKAIINSDETFLKGKHDLTCPYIVLKEDEVDTFKRKSIITSTANITRRVKNYIVCINDLHFQALEQMETSYLLEIYLTYCSFGLSTLCTIGFLVLFCITPSMQTLPVRTISNLVVSLFLAQVVFMFSIGANDDKIFCKVAGIVSHYLWVCTYVWSVICAHHMCKVFRGINKPQVMGSKRLSIYMFFGYITPLLIVAVFVVGENCGCFPFAIGYGGKVCFLIAGRLYGLDGLIICMLVINMVYFGVTVYCIRSKMMDSIEKVSGASTSSFVLYVKISTIMGFSWVFGMLAKWTNIYGLWIVFTVMNGLQGTFIFLVFACSRDVIAAIRQQRKRKNRKGLRSTPHSIPHTSVIN